MDEVWIPIVMFISIAIVLSIYFHFRFRSKKDVQNTIRVALEKGTNMTPEFMEQLRESLVPPVPSDLRKGVLTVALALGLVVFGVLLDEQDATRILIGVSAFPFLIGLAYLGLWKFGK